jgi:hypothetical protein
MRQLAGNFTEHCKACGIKKLKKRKIWPRQLAKLGFLLQGLCLSLSCFSSCSQPVWSVHPSRQREHLTSNSRKFSTVFGFRFSWSWPGSMENWWFWLPLENWEGGWFNCYTGQKVIHWFKGCEVHWMRGLHEHEKRKWCRPEYGYGFGLYCGIHESELQGHLQLEHCAVFQHFMVCIYMNVSLLW